MSSKRYTEEFKAEAVKQIVEQGRSVREMAERLGIGSYSLYEWMRERRLEPEVQQLDHSLVAEIWRLQAELTRYTISLSC